MPWPFTGWFFGLFLAFFVLILIARKLARYGPAALRLVQVVLLVALVVVGAGCVFFHFVPSAAPVDLSNWARAFADRLVVHLPILGFLRRYTSSWVCLAVVAIITPWPYLVQLEQARRRLARMVAHRRPSNGRLSKATAPAPAAKAPEKTPAVFIADCLRNGEPIGPIAPALPRRFLHWFGGVPTGRASDSPLIVKVGLVGRAHAGKSELIDQACLRCTRLPFPSGLHLAVKDPLRLNEIIGERRATERVLISRGRETTTCARSYSLSLLDAGRECLVLRVYDAVGQVLSRTVRTSSAALKEQYEAQLNRLAAADVIWQIVPCPPQPLTLAGEQRFHDDVQLTVSFIRAALDRRQSASSCSLVVVLNRVDTRYPTAEEGGEKIVGDVLNRLAALLRPLRDDPRVSQASLFPVSAWGFGTAMVQSSPTARNEVPVLVGGQAKPGGELLAGEPEWILKRGISPRPFNVKPLLLWSALAGLGSRTIASLGEAAPEMVRIARLLDQDRQNLEGWQYLLKRKKP